jgi:hypothetical protein
MLMQNFSKIFQVFFAPAVDKELDAMIFCYVLHGKIKHLFILSIRFKLFIKIKSPICMLSVKHE